MTQQNTIRPSALTGGLPPTGPATGRSATPPLTAFDFHGHGLRSFTREDGSFWFVAVDITNALGYRDAMNGVRSLEPEEKGTHILSTPGGPQSVLTVSESGLYALILRSRKPQAVAFRLWVTSEVLPSLRRRGVYVVGQEERLPEDMTPEELEAEAQKLKERMALVEAHVQAVHAQKLAEVAAQKLRHLENRQDRDEAFQSLKGINRITFGRRGKKKKPR